MQFKTYQVPYGPLKAFFTIICNTTAVAASLWHTCFDFLSLHRQRKGLSASQSPISQMTMLPKRVQPLLKHLGIP